jgi:hypothetical protein
MSCFRSRSRGRRRALPYRDSSAPPFHQARGRLLYGEWLRRERRRMDARVHLREALGLFRRLRAGLSPRTIDYHLRKVFSKLGIASRTDLVRAGLPEREAA